MPGATIGQTFTTATGTFTQVAHDLEQTTEVQLVAEIYSQADSLFGLSPGFQDTTVLDQTFDDVELVGRPLTIGNFVTPAASGAVFSFDDQHLYALHRHGRRGLPRHRARTKSITGTTVPGSADQLPAREPDPDRACS